MIAAGDFASVHEGLEETIDALRPISSSDDPRARQQRDRGRPAEACEGWDVATRAPRAGRRDRRASSSSASAPGIPTTPWDWSFDLDEEQAAERLAGCPEGAVLVVHSPLEGHCDPRAPATI